MNVEKFTKPEKHKKCLQKSRQCSLHSLSKGIIHKKFAPSDQIIISKASTGNYYLEVLKHLMANRICPEYQDSEN